MPQDGKRGLFKSLLPKSSPMARRFRKNKQQEQQEEEQQFEEEDDLSDLPSMSLSAARPQARAAGRRKSVANFVYPDMNPEEFLG